MIIDCSRKLGFFRNSDLIDFGVKAAVGGAYNFLIFPFTGGFYGLSREFIQDEDIKLDFTFNESGETMIKIQFPSTPTEPLPPNITHVTDKDGIACFIVEGLIEPCI